MPRGLRKIPSYRHQKSRNLAVVTLDGRDVYLGKFDSPESRQEYDRVIQEWLAQGRRLPAPAGPGTAGQGGATLTVSELIARYWSFAETYYVQDGRPARELDGIKIALRPLRRLYGATDAGNFGPLALKAIRQSMIDDGLARTTINARLGKIRRAFKWAVAEELIPSTVHQGLQAVGGLQAGRSAARERMPVRPVDPELVAAVLPLVTAPVRAMIQAQALTGMRPGEVAAMRSGEVDRTGAIWIYRPASHKTQYKGFSRAIPIGPKAQAILAPWIKLDPAAYVFRPADAFGDVDAKPGSTRAKRLRKVRAARARPGRRIGDRYRVVSYHCAIQAACDRAFPHPALGNIPEADLTTEQVVELKAWRKANRWHPNQLRHSAATRIRAEFGLEAAQVTLGHARADVTQIYAERDLTRAIEVMRQIG